MLKVLNWVKIGNNGDNVFKYKFKFYTKLLYNFKVLIQFLEEHTFLVIYFFKPINYQIKLVYIQLLFFFKFNFLKNCTFQQICCTHFYENSFVHFHKFNTKTFLIIFYGYTHKQMSTQSNGPRTTFTCTHVGPIIMHLRS